MSLERIFLEAVMKAFQEMRGKVKSIGAATNLWLVFFIFKITMLLNSIISN